MVRIIPWNLPPVNGGSVGGYTPAPTPVVTSYPYDLDNIVASADFENEFCYIYRSGSGYINYSVLYAQVSISGVGILDATEVSQVTAECSVTAGTISYTNENNVSKTQSVSAADVTIDITSLMTMNGGTTQHSKTEISSSTDIEEISGYIAHITGITFQNSPDTGLPSIDSYDMTIALNSIKVYNSNGVVIQEWSP